MTKILTEKGLSHARANSEFWFPGGEPLKGAKEFTERLHPRDNRGRFAETAGGRAFEGDWNPESVAIISRTLGALEARFPNIPEPEGRKVHIDVVDASSGDRNFYAQGRPGQYGWPDQGTLYLSPTAAEDPDTFEAEIGSAGTETAEGVSPTLQGVVTHEFGHLIYDASKGDPYDPPHDRVVDGALAQAREQFGDDWVKEVTGYGVYSPQHEWFAEAFVDYVMNGENAKPVSKMIGQRIEEAYGKKGAKDFTERLHPRDDRGRFTDTGSLGDTAIRQGGFSLSLAGDRPHSGWMVSQFGSERSFSIEQMAEEQPMEFVPGNPWHKNFTHEVDRFVSDHRKDLRKEGAYLGGWVDSGRLFLDVSFNIKDEEEAREFAQQNEQFAMFHVDDGSYVEFEQSRRAASRMADNQKTETDLKEREKVLLEVDPDEDAETIAERLHRALFG